jgi:DsbC/DsbD-like thiol-disulfide interchange protein
VPLFPIPRAIPEAGGTAIGYKEAVVFPIRLTAAQARDPIALRLVFSFGVCREICIPVDSTLALDLPGNGTGRTPAPAVTAALARVPTVVPDATRATPALLATQFKLDTAKPMLRFETKGAVDLFVEAPEGLFLPMPRQVSAGVWEIDLAQAPDFPEMRGQRLRVTLAREDGGIETTVRVPAK